MSIFGSLFGKKDGGSHGGCCDMRIVEEPTCDCGGACDSASDSGDGTVVKVMGPGCKNCHQLHENALKAVERIGRPIKVEYVTDLAEVAAAGVMSPGAPRRREGRLRRQGAFPCGDPEDAAMTKAPALSSRARLLAAIAIIVVVVAALAAHRGALTSEQMEALLSGMGA